MPRILYPAFLLLLLLPAACGTSTSSSPASSPLATRPAQFAQARVDAPLPQSYVALGASETYGIGAAPRTRSYAYLVARALAARQFRDQGIPGASLHAAYDTELTGALAARPALATAFFGFNDIRGGIAREPFLRDLHDLVITLRSAHTKVLIIGLPNLGLLPAVNRRAHGINVGAIVSDWNGGMRAVARQTGATFLDLHGFSRELAAHPDYISADGLHPNNRGYARLAQIVIGAIHRHHLWPAT